MQDFTSLLKATHIWHQVGMAYGQMLWSANEVIWHRTMQMSMGTMKPEEFARMVFEKPTAFAKSMEMAVRAHASNRDPATASLAAIRPIGAKTKANARRLRQSS